MDNTNRLKTLAGLNETHGDMSMYNDATKKAYDEIEAGQLVDLSDASWSRDTAAIGHFVNVGWAKRIYHGNDVMWQWSGPVAVNINGKLIQPLEYTDSTETDWH